MHTKLPWRVMLSDNATPHIFTTEAIDITDRNHLVCIMPAEIMQSYNSYDNAALIVKAVNSHQDLIDALKKTREELRACQAVIHLDGGFDTAYVKDAQAAMKLADAALAKAQE